MRRFHPELETVKRQLEEALGFIDNMGCDLAHRRVPSWYPEGAHNAAEQMSADMLSFARACLDYEVTPSHHDFSKDLAAAPATPSRWGNNPFGHGDFEEGK